MVSVKTVNEIKDGKNANEIKKTRKDKGKKNGKKHHFMDIYIYTMCGL